MQCIGADYTAYIDCSSAYDVGAGQNGGISYNSIYICNNGKRSVKLIIAYCNAAQLSFEKAEGGIWHAGWLQRSGAVQGRKRSYDGFDGPVSVRQSAFTQHKKFWHC